MSGGGWVFGLFFILRNGFIVVFKVFFVLIGLVCFIFVFGKIRYWWNKNGVIGIEIIV